MAVFQTLGELGSWAASNNVEIVDAGVPLLEWDGQSSYGPAWKNQPSIRKVVGFIARNTASTPLHLYERKSDQDRVRVRDGKLAQLLDRPSRAPGVTAYRFWESLLIDGLLHDKYCAQIVQHADGYELVRIPAQQVRFKGDFLGRITTVLITRDDGTILEGDPADYLLDAGYSTRGANGTSSLLTLKELLDEYREAISYRRSVWSNGARIPGVLEREKPWSSDVARDRFATSWKTFTRGGGKEGGTPVLEDGMTYKEVNAFRPRDTLDLEGRRLTDIEVASSYYIPPELVGAREGTFANIKAFKQMLYGPALGPYIAAWEQLLNLVLVPMLEPSRDVYVEANIESKLRGSFEEQAAVMSTAIGAPWMTRNEGRGKQNLPSITGGDELITPLNVLIGGQASPQDGKAAHPVFAKFAERQNQVVASQKSAGVLDWWDRARWDRELTEDLKAAGLDDTSATHLALQFNDEAESRHLKEGNHEDQDH
ncbi:phage portal protein [Arthrobacter sp. ERGS1:01]|uniref:phage portal protein n=1 Tax=Arthrobacter sp. ERGS1:01 TaxID=1704044 RepID=UPI0006B41926|nr:phage portal protein [Arthrobacter sp. ERGS1:01]